MILIPKQRFLFSISGGGGIASRKKNKQEKKAMKKGERSKRSKTMGVLKASQRVPKAF